MTSSASSGRQVGGGEPVDLDKVGEEANMMISSGDEAEMEETRGGFSTPKGKETRGVGDRTPTGYTPDQKKNRISREEESQEERGVGSGSREDFPPAQITQSQLSEPPPGFQGVPAPPPPGLGGNGSPGEGLSGTQGVLTLQDILSQMQNQMQTGFQNVGHQIEQVRTDINRDVGKLRADQKETKEIASKALTVADETKREMKALANRVATLERGGGQGTSGSASGRATAKTNPREELGYNSLGGPLGNEMVVGEFDQYASREERQQNWEIIKRALPEGVAERVEKVTAPGLRNRVMIVTLKSSPEGPEKTRELLVDTCRTIRQAKIKYTDTDGNMREVYANPTKPLAQRQLDSQVTLKADAIRKAIGEEKSATVELELGKSRIFVGKDILAKRDTPGGPMKYQWPQMHKHLPDSTPDAMEKLEGEVMAARAARSST